MSVIGRFWSRLPPKPRALFTLAALLVCGGACLLGERLYFRATATRVEGTVVGHDPKGRPVVEYGWGGQTRRHHEHGPSERLALGTTAAVYVPPEGPSAARLDNPTALLFLPGWVCLMPATFFLAYGVVVAVRGARQTGEPGAASDPARG